MEKMSTGLCNMLLGGVSGAGSLKTIIDGLFKLFVYDGTPPTTADSALSGNTLLCTVANAGAAVHMAAAASGGVLPMLASETWSGVNAAGGTATFYRFQTTADAGASSAVLPRIQGTIGIGGADMNLGTNVLVISATFTVNYFVQAFVPS